MADHGDAALREMVHALSTLPGQGTSGDYRSAFGRVLEAMLRRAGPDAWAVVDGLIERSKFRPAPSEVAEAVQALMRQAEVDAGPVEQPEGCTDCGWTGLHRVRWLVGNERGALRMEERASRFTCGCPLGRHLLATGKGRSAWTQGDAELHAEVEHYHEAQASGFPREGVAYYEWERPTPHGGYLGWHDCLLTPHERATRARIEQEGQRFGAAAVLALIGEARR